VTLKTVDTSVGVYARTQNIELSANKYNLFLVTTNLVDIQTERINITIVDTKYNLIWDMQAKILRRNFTNDDNTAR
jgi:hypothetical protein